MFTDQKVTTGERCEYEFEFVDGKRRSQRVILLGGGNNLGGGPASVPVPVQTQHSRGVHVLPGVALSFCCTAILSFVLVPLRFS